MNRYWPMLLTLAAVWGASYLFIKVAVDEVEPAPMMAFRTLLAAAVLLGYVVWRLGRAGAFADLRAAWRHCLVLGVLNAALPFWLIAWGEQHIDSGLAAVVQASVPIFNALLVLRFLPHERLTRTRGSRPRDRDRRRRRRHRDSPRGRQPRDPRRARRRALIALVRVRRRLRPARGLGDGRAGARGGLDARRRADPDAVRALPAARSVPSLEATVSILALALLGTALAQLILFRMLALHGSARLSLVTYLIPGFALVYGALILDEEITAAMLGGLALILAGVALASGGVRLPRRREAATARS